MRRIGVGKWIIIANFFMPIFLYWLLSYCDFTMPAPLTSLFYSVTPKMWLDTLFISEFYSAQKAQLHVEMYALIFSINFIWHCGIILMISIVCFFFDGHKYYNSGFVKYGGLDNFAKWIFIFIATFLFIFSFITSTPITDPSVNFGFGVHLGWVDFAFLSLLQFCFFGCIYILTVYGIIPRLMYASSISKFPPPSQL